MPTGIIGAEALVTKLSEPLLAMANSSSIPFGPLEANDEPTKVIDHLG